MQFIHLPEIKDKNEQRVLTDVYSVPSEKLCIDIDSIERNSNVFVNLSPVVCDQTQTNVLGFILLLEKECPNLSGSTKQNTCCVSHIGISKGHKRILEPLIENAEFMIKGLLNEETSKPQFKYVWFDCNSNIIASHIANLFGKEGVKHIDNTSICYINISKNRKLKLTVLSNLVKLQRDINIGKNVIEKFHNKLTVI